MRPFIVAGLLALAVLSVPAASARPGPIGGDCDGLVDAACSDPWGTPNGATCLVAVGGHCLAWASPTVGGGCDGLVDTACTDPYGQPGGTICLLAVDGHCLAWL